MLDEALEATVPLLERVKFLVIVSSNLDEFFMVRVAALKRRIQGGDETPGPDGLTPRETLASATASPMNSLYLEHARVFPFANAGAPEYLLASADWMPRNLDRRVEIAFPVLEPALQAEIHTVLATPLADTRKARILLGDGTWCRPGAAAAPLRSQERLDQLAAARA